MNRGTLLSFGELHVQVGKELFRTEWAPLMQDSRVPITPQALDLVAKRLLVDGHHFEDPNVRSDYVSAPEAGLTGMVVCRLLEYEKMSKEEGARLTVEFTWHVRDGQRERVSALASYVFMVRPTN